VLLIPLLLLTACSESPEAKRNNFDSCVIEKMAGYLDTRPVRELVPYENNVYTCNNGECEKQSGYYIEVDKEVMVQASREEAEQLCVGLLN